MRNPNETEIHQFPYVTIREINSDRRLDKMSDMKIDGDRIAFFAETILETSSFQASKAGDLIQATFFKGSKFEITLLAELHETSDAADRHIAHFLSKGAFIAGKLDAETCREASQFLRQANSLTEDEACRTAKDRSLFVDSGAFAYIANDYHQFKRVILTAMLGKAYLKTLEKRISELSEAARNTDDIQKSILLYDDMLKFNAGFYQRFPIKVTRHELSKVWEAISDHFRIDDLRAELDAQLSALAQWLREERLQKAETERREQMGRDNAAREARHELEERRDKRFNRYVAIISILLAFLALPESIQNGLWEWARSSWNLASGWLSGRG